jgi:carbon storage regulator
MLILSRKKGQSIVIVTPQNEMIEIFVTKVDYDQVKVGLEAPRVFKIFRREVYDDMIENPDPVR